MPYYFVNANAQPGGEHEVHEKHGCPYAARLENQIDLGFFVTCIGAMQAAAGMFDKVDGCARCCAACHSK
jgi:hypothetical protein